MMYFEKENVKTNYYSVLLKGAAKTIAICAEKKVDTADNYEFYIEDNLIVILPKLMIENIV